jgi:hypothetical protein
MCVSVRGRAAIRKLEATSGQRDYGRQSQQAIRNGNLNKPSGSLRPRVDENNNNDANKHSKNTDEQQRRQQKTESRSDENNPALPDTLFVNLCLKVDV